MFQLHTQMLYFHSKLIYAPKFFIVLNSCPYAFVNLISLQNVFRLHCAMIKWLHH